MKKCIADIAFIILGAFFFALAVNLFVIPNEFGEGALQGSQSSCTTCFSGLPRSLIW